MLKQRFLLFYAPFRGETSENVSYNRETMPYPDAYCIKNVCIKNISRISKKPYIPFFYQNIIFPKLYAFNQIGKQLPLLMILQGNSIRTISEWFLFILSISKVTAI